MTVLSVFTHSDFTRILHANDGVHAERMRTGSLKGWWLEEQASHSGVLFDFSLVL